MTEPARILNGDVIIAGVEETANTITIGKSTDSVDVSGTLSLGGVTPGSTNPALAFIGDEDTGVGRAATNELSLITGGFEAINIGSTQEITFYPGASVVGLTIQLDATPGNAIEIVDDVGASVFLIDGVGNVTMKDSVTEQLLLSSSNDQPTPSLAFAGDTNTGIRHRTENRLTFVADGTDRWEVESATFQGTSIGVIGWASGIMGLALDVRLSRDAAGVLNFFQDVVGGSATFKIYGTTDSDGSPTDFTRASLSDDGSGTVRLAAETGGTGIDDIDIVLTPAGTGGVAISDAVEGNTARLTRRTTHEAHTLANAATSDTTTISIPSGARLLAVGFNVNTAVVDDGGDDTWSAAFITGSTTTLATAAAAAQDTKLDLMLPDEISTGVCEIRFTANAGNFSAGVIEIVAYYETLTSLANV